MEMHCAGATTTASNVSDAAQLMASALTVVGNMLTGNVPPSEHSTIMQRRLIALNGLEVATKAVAEFWMHSDLVCSRYCSFICNSAFVNVDAARVVISTGTLYWAIGLCTPPRRCFILRALAAIS